MPVYSVGEVFDKTLVAKKTLLGYKGFEGAKETYVFKPGDIIGQVFSYIPSKIYPNQILWMIKDNTHGQAGKYFYVYHFPENFDLKTLQEQGAKSDEERIKEKEEANKDIFDKISDKAVTAGKWIGAGAVLYFGIKLIIDYKKSAK